MAGEIFLHNSSFSGPLPTQIGQLTEFDWGDMRLYSNSFSGTLPTQFGQLTQMPKKMLLYANSFSGPLPTQLGRLVLESDMGLNSNSFSGPVPTEIGQLTNMTEGMYLNSNMLCDDVPTQVQALSSQVDGWYVTTGNSFGTPCMKSATNSATDLAVGVLIGCLFGGLLLLGIVGIGIKKVNGKAMAKDKPKAYSTILNPTPGVAPPTGAQEKTDASALEAGIEISSVSTTARVAELEDEHEAEVAEK